MNGVQAFTDEYGNASLAVEKPGVTSFFIITAVLVRDDVVAEQRTRADAIRAKSFGAGEMKSSSVGQDDDRRKRILTELMELDIRTYSLAVDKRELDREGGLAHRKSFFKYLNRRLYERVFKNIYNTKLVADEHGREDFMRSFVDYVNRHLPLTLFTRREVSFATSGDEVMLQIADMISGSFARVLDPGKRSPFADDILSLLQKRSLGVEVWPPRGLPEIEAAPEPGDDEKDSTIKRHCLRRAHLFLRESIKSDEPSDELRAQIEVLHVLLFQLQFADPKKYVPTSRIRDRLRSEIGLQLSTRKLRSLISAMRDAGVVIGRSSKGYKLPIDERDMEEFVAHANSIVPPMLARVRRAKQDLSLASLGKLDILAPAKFSLLRRLVATLDAEESAEKP